MIIDIGCGNGLVLRKLHNAGHKKLMGFDPFTDMIEFNQRAIKECGERIHFMPLDVGSERFYNFVQPMVETNNMDIMFLLCRPCHNGRLVDGAFKVAKELGVELLYIGLEENIDLDLGDIIPYTTLDHKGSSEDDEIVLKLG
ncbi:MAG: class I SAM-dependent methyltransferase [Sphaerochaetaceae bacterium]|nr:class I SAM-dependent methyltransferase [Sphaerochaetaceae bacterium]